jgi:hypothetical protein
MKENEQFPCIFSAEAPTQADFFAWRQSCEVDKGVIYALDLQRSWVVCTELNRFLWPGAALRPIPDRPGTIASGGLPSRLVA